MATIYKRGGKKNRGGTYIIQYTVENGIRRTQKGCSDRDATETLARKIEADVMLKKWGIIDQRADRFAKEGRKSTDVHIETFHADVLARGVKVEYADKLDFRIRKVFELAGVRYLPDITPSVIQTALGRIKDDGRSPKTCNNTLAAVK